MSWRNALIRRARESVLQLENRFDELRFDWRIRLGRIDRVAIQPYRAFGTLQSVTLRGRVLEDHGREAPDDRESLWRNLLASYRRFESDEIPGARVRARFGGADAVAMSDEEGYFEVDLRFPRPISEGGPWHDAHLELVDPPLSLPGPVRSLGPFVIPPADAEFGVISDVDDTILKTDATSLLQAARLTFLRSARMRVPFKGVAAFYRALQRGATGRGANPIFFVSSSPWNLYDLLVDFCEHHRIPRGPLLLRDLGLNRDQWIAGSHRAHKRKQIHRILSTYPELPFILIGDSGQKDPEIYSEVAQDHPRQIKAVYIRDVSMDARDAEVHEIADSLQGRTPLLFSADTVGAARDAAARGLIEKDSVAEIEEDAAEDAR